MYIVDRGASVYLMGLLCLRGGERVPSGQHNATWRYNIASGIVRSATAAKVYIQERGTSLYVKLVEDFPSALWLCQLRGFPNRSVNSEG